MKQQSEQHNASSPAPMICMQNVEQTEVSWLWYPYIPFGKLTILQGNPGEGKTYFAMQLAAACTTGKALPNMTPLEPFNVIYQTAEDGLGDTVKPRLMEAGADLTRVLVIDDGDSPLTLSDERIERAIAENQAHLLIIDPIHAFLLSGEEHTQTKLEQAQSLILSMLKGSRTCWSSDLEKAAADHKISSRTLRMAKQQLAGRLKMYREGTQWMVELRK